MRVLVKAEACRELRVSPSTMDRRIATRDGQRWSHLYLGGHGHAIRVQDVGDHHVGAFACEQTNLRSGLTVGAACDQGYFSLQLDRKPRRINN